MAVARLTQWTAGGSSLRGLDAAGAGEGCEVPDHRDEDPDRDHDWMAASTDEDDGDNRPGERLPVYRSEGAWRDPRTGDYMRTVHGFASESALQRAECVLGQGSLWQEAAALSAMSAGPYDIRPRLLLLLVAEDLSGLAAIIRHGDGYLRGWCERMGKARGEAATRAAAADALARLYRTRDRRTSRGSGRLNVPSLASRSREFGCRNGDYAELRATAQRMYEVRLSEAIQRFNIWHGAFAGFKPARGTTHVSGRAPETWWHPERLPPAKR